MNTRRGLLRLWGTFKSLAGFPNNQTMPGEEPDLEANLRQEEEERKAYQLIGEFIYWYSQLEYAIKDRLATELNLAPNLIDVVLSYDFLMLCTVTKNVLFKKYDDPKDKKIIEGVLNECAGLNIERLRVAHGLWLHDNPTGLVARHVARGTLRHTLHFRDPDELPSLIKKAQKLMERVMEIPRQG
jgi:hypothetical protein